MKSIATAARENAVLCELPMKERRRVTTWLEVIEIFESADNKGLALETLRAEYGHLVRMSQGTLYRKLAAWRDDGIYGLLPARIRNRILIQQALPHDFIEFWQDLCCANQRKTSPAWRSLYFDHLMPGRRIPGYDSDWRGIFSSEHPGWAIPDACPYAPGAAEPRGWSLRNLRRYAPNVYQLVAARQGRMSAKEHLPSVPTTRVGLPFMRVVVIDDVEHDTQVTFAGNRSPHHVVELGALELLTGDYISWGAKPIRERADGSKEKLKEAFNRYLLADLVCRIGFCEDGLLICGEHGTAKLPDELMQALSRWTGDRVKFAAGGILNKPIMHGLYLGARRGNFRFKAALESHHNLKKNELAQLPGQKGADPEHAPEDLPAKTQYHRALMLACAALSEDNPNLFYQVRSEFPPFHQYMDAVGMIYDRISMRTLHDLEGWDECGFTLSEVRIPPAPQWVPEMELDNMPAEEARMIRELVRRDPKNRYRRRKMSPREASLRMQNDARLVKLPPSAFPDLCGPELGQTLEVGHNLEIDYRDPYVPGRSAKIAAVIVTPDGDKQVLARGEKALVHLSPFDGRQAFISTPAPDCRFLGMAPVMIGATKIDAEVLLRNLKIISTVESEELKRLAPVGRKRLEKLVEDREHNLRTIAGRDPINDETDEREMEESLAGVRVSAADASAAGEHEQGDEWLDDDEIANMLS
jgi:hypothetical protein